MPNLASLQNISSLGVKYTTVEEYLLAQYSGAITGLSLRNLNDIASTDVVRVRRSSDNTESDFTAKEVKNGTLLNYVVPTDVQALYSNRMYFDGVNDYIFVNDSADLAITGDIRLECKFNFTSFTGIPYILNAQKANSENEVDNLQYALFIDASGNLGWFQEYGAGNNEVISFTGFTFSTNTLYDIYVTKNVSTKEGKLYVKDSNGVYQLEDTQSYTNEVTGSPATVDLIIGASPTLSSYSEGVIFDIAIYNSLDTSVPVASYQGYGNTNANWEDQVGSNDGTVNGSPALFTGQGFNGFVTKWYDQTVSRTAEETRIYLNGVDQYVEVSDADNLSFGNGGTDQPFSFGFKMVSNDLEPGDAIAKVNADASVREYRVILNDNSGNVNFALYNSGATGQSLSIEVVGGSAVLADGEEHEVVVTYDGSKTIGGMKIYFDGVEQTTIDVSGGGYTGMSNTAGSLYFGKVTNLYQEGSFYDIKAFDKELSSAEAGDYMSVSDDDVVSYWKGYGNQNSNWEDQVGSNDGTVNGSPENAYKVIEEDTYRLPNDAIQTTASNQPTIVSNGALITKDGEPAIQFTASGSNYLDTTLTNGTESSYSIFTVIANSGSSNAFGGIFDARDANDDGLGIAVLNNSEFRFHVDTDDRLITEDTNQNLLSATWGSSVSTLRKNGGSEQTGSAPASIDHEGTANIGVDGFSINGFFDGKIQEIVVFSDDKTSVVSDIEKNINLHYKIY